MRDLILIGAGLLVLWYMSEPEPAQVVTMPVTTFEVEAGGVVVRGGF